MNAPVVRHAPFKPLTTLPRASDFSSQSAIVLFNDSIFSLVFSGDNLIALFSIPILKLKFEELPALSMLGETETFANFFKLTFVSVKV